MEKSTESLFPARHQKREIRIENKERINKVIKEFFFGGGEGVNITSIEVSFQESFKGYDTRRRAAV